MKKYHALSLLFVFWLNNIDGQNIDFNFFETSLNLEGKNYSKALFRAEIDSFAVIKTYGFGATELITVEMQDTIILMNFLMLKQGTDFSKIASFVDTTKTIAKVKDERNYFPQKQEEMCFEWIKELKPKIEDFHNWVPLNDSNLLDESNWKFKEVVEKVEVKRYVVTSPCHHRFETVPAEYRTITIVTPNRELTGYEKQLFLDHTTNSMIIDYTQKIYYSEKKESYFVKNFEYRIIKKAQISEVEVYTEEQMLNKMELLKNELNKEGIFLENEGNSFTEIKAGIIKFQLKNRLPIGQFDKITIDKLLMN